MLLTKKLGHTNINASVLSMGTVALGMKYGIDTNNEYDSPSVKNSMQLLEYARDVGVNFYDTAPSYGDSEKLLGRVFCGDTDCYIASKISSSVTRTSDRSVSVSQDAIVQSIRTSITLLKREYLDVLQLHNATIDNFRDDVLLDTLQICKSQGLVKYIGATIYNKDEAIAAIESKIVDILQVPFSILDQRLLSYVLPLAKSAGIGIVARSVLLKGVLSAKSCYLPPHLYELREASARIKRHYDVSWEELTKLAIRFCLTVREIDTVLLGVTTPSELNVAIDAVNLGTLSEADMRDASDFQIVDNELLNPSYW